MVNSSGALIPSVSEKQSAFFLFLSNKEMTEIQYSSSLQEVVVKNIYH